MCAMEFAADTRTEQRVAARHDGKHGDDGDHGAVGEPLAERQPNHLRRGAELQQ